MTSVFRPKINRLFTRVKLEYLRPQLEDGRRLFFVTGRGKSGTTWMAKLLTAHPNLFCDPKENLGFHYGFRFNYLADCPELLYGKIEANMKRKTRELIKNGLVTTLLKKCDKPSVAKLGDKTPDQDVGRILDAFPHTQVVIMLRDFRDVCVSLAFHAARLSGTWRGYFETPEKRFLDNHFLSSVLTYYAGLGDVDDYMEQAQQRPEQVTLVKYEDLKASPSPTLAETFHFLGVTTEGAIVQNSLERNTFQRTAKGRKPGESNVDSFYRKGIVGDWKNHFSSSNKEVFKAISNHALVKFSYEQNDKW
jgi:hypothetical protein